MVSRTVALLVVGMAALGLVGCDGQGMEAGTDAGAFALDTSTPNRADAGCSRTLAASVFGDSWTYETALSPPVGVNTLHAVIYVDGATASRDCWYIDSNGSIRVNPVVFPDANLHQLAWSFDCPGPSSYDIQCN